MVQKGAQGVRAKFADAKNELAQKTGIEDPAPYVDRDGFAAGQWPGAPFDKLPPGCPVVPLGVDGKVSFLIDTLGQLLSFDGMKEDGLIKLFRSTPNYLYWAWPRITVKEKDGKAVAKINGVEIKKAIACLEKACAARGLFDPANRVRGRGAWTDKSGQLIWHSGDALYRVLSSGDGNSKLQASPPGEIDGIFYPRRASIMAPWAAPVPPSDSPAREILTMLQTWTWDRPKLDPLIVLGGIGTMLIGGALPWRPHVAAMGDKGVGKSELNDLMKAIMSTGLIDAANTTEAGVRQHMGLDALPVAIDEFEAAEDNRRVVAIIELARIACSGGRLLRGGQDHKGVEFIARNAFFCSGINLPPMKPQDLSRFAVLNLGKLQLPEGSKAPVIHDEWGRMLLRSLMDAWPTFHATHADWKNVLRSAGIDGRGQDTYGTLFAIAQMLLGVEDMEELGIDITEPTRLGALIAAATADERSEQTENWRACLEHLIGSPIDALKNGTRHTIGAITEECDAPHAAGYEMDKTKELLAHAGCGLVEEPDPAAGAGHRRYLLAVPPNNPALAKLFNGTRWSAGGWFRALKQAPDTIVRRGANGRVVKINRAAARCLLIDLKAYDKHMGV